MHIHIQKHNHLQSLVLQAIRRFYTNKCMNIVRKTRVYGRFSSCQKMVKLRENVPRVIIPPSLKSLIGPLKCEIGHVSYMDKSAHDCTSIEYVLFTILRRFTGFQIDWYSLTRSTFKTFLGPFIMISSHVFVDIQINIEHGIQTHRYIYTYIILISIY